MGLEKLAPWIKRLTIAAAPPLALEADPTFTEGLFNARLYCLAHHAAEQLGEG